MLHKLETSYYTKNILSFQLYEKVISLGRRLKYNICSFSVSFSYSNDHKHLNISRYLEKIDAFERF